MQPNETSSNEARNLLKNQLDELLQNLFELSVIVYDFQPDGNKLVWKKINSIIEHYREIDDLREGISEHVPEEVINFVEHGKNPDLFTQSFVERTATENQYTNGKVNAVDEFKHLLTAEFTKSFPDLYDYENSIDYKQK